MNAKGRRIESAALRDEAVAAVLDNIPAYMERGYKEDYCVWQLAVRIPPEARGKYGFETRHQSMSLEDGFGSYDASYEEIIYKGKTYTP